MLNITAILTNLRTNQTYTVNHIPVELAQLKIKGEFNIKFPFGFNRGISSEKVKFVKVERQLLIDDYKVWEASANWELLVFYGNLTNPLTVTLDFTNISWDSVEFEIGFKITPLLDRLRNFEKTNEFISFEPQNYTLRTITPQNFQANFNHNSLSTSTITIADLQSDGMIDADGLEYNFPIPDKNDAIAIFRVAQKTASQTASYFSLDIYFKYLNIKMWMVNGIITLKLKTDYLFYYDDNTHEYSNIIQDSCSSAALYTETEVRNSYNHLPKNVELSELPSDPLKTLTECYIVTYLQVVAPTSILQNAIRIWSNHIHISHNFIQIDEVYKGVKVSDYLQKVNQLAGEPIFDESLLFILSDIVISSTNFMLSINKYLKGKLMDVIEAISIVAGFSFIEIDGKYFISTINLTPNFGTPVELTNFSDLNYEPTEQIIDFEIGDDTDVKFQMLPRLFEKRKYYMDNVTSTTLATLDALIIKPKVITSGELIINKLMDKKHDDDLLFLKIENVNYGSFGPVLNQYFSNKNIIDRLTRLLNSFFTTQLSSIKYRNDNNQIISHDLSSTNRLFAKYYRNITTPATSAVISALLDTYRPFKIDGKIYLPVEYSLNLEPNTFNIKLLEML